MERGEARPSSAARVWIFVALLGGIDLLAFVVPDLATHATRALESRYLTITWLALELATAFGLATATASLGVRTRAVASIAAAYVFALGMISCAVASNARVWWIAGSDFTMPGIALALAERPDTTIVYLVNSDLLLELLPSARSDLHFALHRTVDRRTLASAAHPVVFTSAAALADLPAGSLLAPIALPKTFPSMEDASIVRLHRNAASQRNTAFGRDAIYAPKTAGR